MKKRKQIFVWRKLGYKLYQQYTSYVPGFYNISVQARIFILKSELRKG